MILWVAFFFKFLVSWPFYLSNATAHDGMEVQPSSILVKLKAAQECVEQPTMAWFSQGRTLLYQADVSPEGDFEIFAKPGQYNLVVTGKSGCFVEKGLKLSVRERQEMALQLAHPVNRRPAKLLPQPVKGTP